MVTRQGSERGVVELTFLILLIMFHLRLLQAVDAEQISPDELDEPFDDIRERRWELPTVAKN